MNLRGTLKRILGKISLSALATSVVLGSGAVAQADIVKDIMDRGKIVVGVQTQGPPISFVDKNGERTGLAVELVRLLAADMGVEIEFKTYEWKGLIPALLSEKVDFLAADMTPTIKRSTALNFTDPYFYADTVAFAPDSAPFTSWQDLNSPDVTVAVLQGSSHVDIVKRMIPQAKIKEYAGGGAAITQAVMSGRADAGVNGFSTIRGFQSSFEDIRILDGVLSRVPAAWPTRPEDTHLLHMLNNFIRLKEADGSLKELVDYWWTTTDWEADHK